MISSSSRRWFVTSLVLLATSFRATKAALNLTIPLNEQLPQVAHSGEAYTWSFADSTFTDTDASESIILTASNLPKWASFDASTRTFSGTPASSDVARTRVTVKATSISDEAQSTFELVVVSDGAPRLKSALTDQLPTASSLGRSHILQGGKIHIPWGWSFSVGWSGNTFYLPSGANVYTHASIAGGKALPKWLKYSAKTYAMWGIAPNRPGPEGTEFVFTLTGSNVPGMFGGTQTNVTVVLGTGGLSLSEGGFPVLNATVGQAVDYMLPVSSVQIDGQKITDLSIVKVTADTSKASWLTYNSATRKFSGIPSGTDGSLNTKTTTSVPVTITDSQGKTLTSNVQVSLFPPTFSGSSLPNVSVEPGKPFNASVASSVRDSSQHNITMTLDPQSALDWVSFNATDLTLSGTAPRMRPSDKVRVTLSSQPQRRSSIALGRRDSTQSNQPANQASFYIAPIGTNPGPAVVNERTSGRISHKGKLGVAIGFAVAGGLLALLFLAVAFRKWCMSGKRASAATAGGNGRLPDLSDDRTLYVGASSAVVMDGAWSQKKEMFLRGAVSPTVTIIGSKSPYLMPDGQRAGGVSPGSELKGILIGGRNYGYATQASNYATRGEMEERPKQHGFMSALVQGAKKRFPSSKSLARDVSTGSAANVAPSASTGLGLTGLGLEAPGSDDPYPERPQGHARSRLSLRSSASKESWEEDLFYPTTPANEASQPHQRAAGLAPVIEVDEVPNRRNGVGRISSRINPMRTRNSHINASAAFAIPGTFGLPATEESSQGHSTEEGGELPAVMSENFVIGTAQRVDVRDIGQHGSVQSYTSDMTQGPHRSLTKHSDALCHYSGAFDDADGDEQTVYDISRQSDYVAAETMVTGDINRNSAMSTVTANSQMAALGPYISYPDPSKRKPPPLFSGASNVSNIRPEETLRPVLNSSYGRLASTSTPRPRLSKSRFVENLEANVSMGERVRIKLTPPGGAAMMGGAPGSPGKRSNRAGKYLPVLDDVSMQAHGTWPIWLSEWLHWDPRVFELSGEVPLDFELPEVHIALVHRRPLDSAASPVGHRRDSSSESVLASVEDEVVVRLTLFIEWSEHIKNSGQQVYLRREGTGTAF